MRLRRTSRQTVAVAAVIAAAGTLAGCDGPTRASFAASADKLCHNFTVAEIALADRGSVSDVDYAISYYTIYNGLVTDLREHALPAADAARIRAGWFRPAQQALADFRPTLTEIRSASRTGNTARADALLVKLRRLGRGGVSGNLLRSLDVPACEQIFGSAASA